MPLLRGHGAISTVENIENQTVLFQLLAEICVFPIKCFFFYLAVNGTPLKLTVSLQPSE